MKNILLLISISILTLVQSAYAGEKECRRRPGSKIRICKNVKTTNVKDSRDKKDISSFQDMNKNILDDSLLQEFDVNYLVALGKYSENVNKLDQYIVSRMGSRRKRKRLIKSISSDFGLRAFCSNVFIKNEKETEIKDRCIEGFFNVCPKSFSNYKIYSKNIYKNLQSLFGQDQITNSECNSYFSEES